MSARKTSLTDKQSKNGTSKYVLERCASINEYYDIAFKVCIPVLSCVCVVCDALFVVQLEQHEGYFAGGLGTAGCCTTCFNNEYNPHIIYSSPAVCPLMTDQVIKLMLSFELSRPEPVNLSRLHCPPFLICKHLLRVEATCCSSDPPIKYGISGSTDTPVMVPTNKEEKF